MDKITRITKNEFYEIAAVKGFNPDMLAKDYALTEILFILKDTPDIYFKGGTALQKTILRHSRLSEDIDFTVTADVKKIDSGIVRLLEATKLFPSITHDKGVAQFTRIVVSYNLFGELKGEVFIDLNERAKLLEPPVHKAIEHFYGKNIPKFSINLLGDKELIAEKMAAGIACNKPRDHYDIYRLIKTGHKIDRKLAEEKCRSTGIEFSIVKLFSNANTLKNRWDTDMVPLLSQETDFPTMMRYLAKHFKLKKEKQKLKKKKVYR